MSVKSCCKDVIQPRHILLAQLANWNIELYRVSLLGLVTLSLGGFDLNSRDIGAFVHKRERINSPIDFRNGHGVVQWRVTSQVFQPEAQARIS